MATKASVSATTNKAYYDPDEPMEISAVVRDKQGEAADCAKVVATVQGPDGQSEQVTLSAVAGPSGHYGGTVEPRTAGGGMERGRGPVRRTKLEIRQNRSGEIGLLNLEFEKLDLDEKMLERIAADTGGRYVPLSTADHLVDQLDHTPAQTDRAHRAAALLAARLLGCCSWRC